MEQQATRPAAKTIKPLELKKVTASDPQVEAHVTEDLPPTVRIFYGPRDR
jgi:hypothetical protein